MVNIVIQCAASKVPDAGYLRDRNGRRVHFVAHPHLARSLHPDEVYAHPDDLAFDGLTWRQSLLEYNRNINNNNNIHSLKEAYLLYKNRIYRDLVEYMGKDKVFIFSAGWGIVKADFFLPYYDITFSQGKNVEKYKIRTYNTLAPDFFDDFCMIDLNDKDDLLFFGGKNYVAPFLDITDSYKGKRIIFYNSSIPPSLPPNCISIKYNTKGRTNWHYKCVRDFICGNLFI